ncbi:MAG: hypothetical protein QM756_30670 [Polyangiaceae bacterium]
MEHVDRSHELEVARAAQAKVDGRCVAFDELDALGAIEAPQ